MYRIFRTPVHHLGPSSEPDNMLYAGKLCPTAAHPRGWLESPDYELRADGKIYRSEGHPLGAGNRPDDTIGPDCLLYRTDGHPDGPTLAPEYEPRELSSQPLIRCRSPIRIPSPAGVKVSASLDCGIAARR